ncbi:MAG: hypothetical protein V1774_07245, partial [Candidatus Eisenbacteria bacterium]
MKMQGRRGTRPFDSSRVGTLFLLVTAVALWNAGAVLPAFGMPAAPVSHDAHLLLQTPAPTGRIIVKFVESSGLTVENGRLKPRLADADHARIESLLGRLASVHGSLRLERHFTRSPEEIDQDRRNGQRRLGRALPNLNRYARIVPDLSLTHAALLEIVSELIADPSVETAFLEPVAVPAALGFDAFTGKFDPDQAGRLDPEQTGPLDAGQTSRGADHLVPAGSVGAPLSPDFSGLQLYLDPAPAGVDAEGVWGVPGGAGQSVKVIDIEGAWLWTHEDLPAPFFTAGTPFNDQSWRNHGTAVMGEMRGISNTLGVTGIAYQCQVGAVSVAEMSVADAINTAAAHLDEGDVFLIEL